MELVRQHEKETSKSVDADPGKSAPLRDLVALAGEGDVKLRRLLAPQLLHGHRPAVIFDAHRAVALEAGAIAVLGSIHDEDEVVHPCRYVHGRGQAREESRNGPDDGPQRAAGRLLPELAAGEAEDVPLDHDAAHVLVASPHTRGGRTTIDKRVDPREPAGGVVCGRQDRSLDRPQLASAAGPNRQMIRVRDVDAEREVAAVQGHTQLRRGGVRDSPICVHVVTKPSVGDEPVERRGAFGDGPARLQENRHAVVPAHVLEDTGREPLGDDGTEGPFSRFVLLPRRVVGEGGLLSGG